jgi:uncharacterized integral membrane protein (TIGR00697 family)
MDQKQREQSFTLYLILAAMFIAALVSSNLIFQKFFTWNPFGWYNFEISVGIIPYPITFIITDIISEIYGRKRANQVVIGGIAASFFSLFIVYTALNAQATEWSPVNNQTFESVFGLSAVAVFASMMAYLLAQFIDIRIFHFWKKLTKGKHLWLRNNGSTIISQLTDTATVLGLLIYFDVIEADLFWALLANGFLFKVIVALIDTPVFYLSSYLIKKKFGLGLNDEIREF